MAAKKAKAEKQPGVVGTNLSRKYESLLNSVAPELLLRQLNWGFFRHSKLKVVQCTRVRWLQSWTSRINL